MDKIMTVLRILWLTVGSIAAGALVSAGALLAADGDPTAGAVFAGTGALVLLMNMAAGLFLLSSTRRVAV